MKVVTIRSICLFVWFILILFLLLKSEICTASALVARLLTSNHLSDIVPDRLRDPLYLYLHSLKHVYGFLWILV